MRAAPDVFPIRNCHLKNLELYKENNHYFLQATYIYEDDFGIYELLIPKIKTGFSYSALPVLERDNIDPIHETTMGKSLCWLKSDGETMRVLEDEDRVFYYVKEIEKKSVEMTIEEIEKKLGHPVKIVKEVTK